MEVSGMYTRSSRAAGLRVYTSGKPQVDIMVYLLCATATLSGMPKAVILVLQVHNLIPQSNLTLLFI